MTNSQSQAPLAIAHQPVVDAPEFKNLIPFGVPLNLAIHLNEEKTALTIYTVTNNFEGVALTVDREGIQNVCQQFLNVLHQVQEKEMNDIRIREEALAEEKAKTAKKKAKKKLAAKAAKLKPAPKKAASKAKKRKK